MTIGRIAVILASILLMLKQNATANNHTLAYKHLSYTSSEVSLIAKSRQAEDLANTELLCSYNKQWFCYDTSTTRVPYCINNSHITCSDGGPLLQFGYCATYSEDTGLVAVAKCPYLQVYGHVYNVTSIRHDYFIQLPKTLTELNDSMCGPMNRKGVICSECIDGFGPSITSIGYKCANCTNIWYGVPLYIVLLFAPITVFYLFILIFQVKVTSPPVPCFIMYAQVVVMEVYLVNFGKLSTQVVFNNRGHLRLDAAIILALYGLFNLDFFYSVLPPFCISSRIKPIHIAFLGYTSVLYPIVLIFLTWLCVELHGYNFRPIVWLWRPFHRCCVKLRRSWDNKNDVIDVFATFFLLSYHKCLYQSVLLLSRQSFWNYNSTVGHAVQVSLYTRIMADLSVTTKSSEHIPYAVLAAIVAVLFYILPSLLLMLYPINVFRRLLSKCHLDFIAVNIFVDKIYGDYKNGLNGGRDMRSLSGLYFILRVVLILSSCVIYHGVYDSYVIGCAILFGSALMIALLKPYNKSYMNYLDTLLLANYALIWYICTAQLAFSMVLVKFLFSLPMAIFVLGIIVRSMSNKNRANKISSTLLSKARNLLSKGQQEQQPLLQPN